MSSNPYSSLTERYVVRAAEVCRISGRKSLRMVPALVHRQFPIYHLGVLGIGHPRPKQLEPWVVLEQRNRIYL